VTIKKGQFIETCNIGYTRRSMHPATNNWR